MEKEDAVGIMAHLAGRLDQAPTLELEDMVSAFAEFLAHIQPQLGERDFAFLATIGAMIYRKGFRQYDSSLETDLLMQKLQASGCKPRVRRKKTQPV
ncbi:MAG: hypothetical protein WBG17_06505 [Burkholderiaceae bacterium]